MVRVYSGVGPEVISSVPESPIESAAEYDVVVPDAGVMLVELVLEEPPPPQADNRITKAEAKILDVNFFI
jgi:hypothetical protein